MKRLKNVVLDLDNTLLCAEELSEFPFDRDGIREKSLQFHIHDMEGYYIVFERPDLQEFLDWLFSNFNVSIWTAAGKDYALFVIQNIILQKPNRTLDYIFFDYHVSISKKMFRKQTKNLRLLFEAFCLEGYSAKNTLIIDDYDHVIETNPQNSIHIKEFNFMDEGSHRDDELMTVVKPKLQKLKFI